MGDHLRLASMGNRLSVYRNFAASGSTSGIRRPCNTQTVRVSRSVKREYGEGERRKLGRGRTRRLAIFRVHSVAKPQLTALLGSYSSSLNLLCPPSPSTDCPFSSGLCFHPVLLLRSPASDGDAVCFSSRPAVTCPFLLVQNLPSFFLHVLLVKSHMLLLFCSASLLNLSVFLCSLFCEMYGLVPSHPPLLQWMTSNNCVFLR